MHWWIDREPSERDLERARGEGSVEDKDGWVEEKEGVARCHEFPFISGTASSLAVF